jgi:hypothetical protein
MRVAMALVSVAILAGCAAQPAPRAAELPALPPGAQPFDLFRRADLAVIEKADLKLFNDCLADGGYPQERAIGNDPGPVVPGLLQPAINPRTEAEARRHGFGTPLPSQPAAIVRKDPAFFEAATKCEKSAREALGSPREVGSLRDRYAALGNSLVQDRTKKTQATMVAFSKRLTACLAGHGYRLHDGEEFSTRGDLSQFGIVPGSHVAAQPVEVRRPEGLPAEVEVQPAVPARAYQPSKAEVAFAVAFVRCGRTTGLFAALDRAEPVMQKEIVERHVAEFSGLNPQIEALAAKAAEVLKGR